MGTANTGVPQKTMCMAEALRSLPLALFLQLLDSALDEVALEQAEVLQEQDAVEVVNLMTEGAREEFLASNLENLSPGVLRADGHKLRANDVSAEAGDREASFFFALFALRVDDFGVCQDDPGFRIFPRRNVHNRDAYGLANLWRGEADALC